MQKYFFLAMMIFTGMANATHPDELVIAINSEFETLNPLVNTMIASFVIQDATVRQMIVLTPEGKPRAVMIKEIPILENKKATLVKRPDGLGIKTDLEFIEAAKWGDGVPVTCLDLQASWEIGRDNGVSVSNRQGYENIESIDIDPSNPKKCSVTFKEAKWDFILNFPRLVPAHLEMKVFKEFKGQPQGYERNSIYVRQPTNPGLFNGPYRISEYKLGSHVVLVPNPQFFGTVPKIKKILFKFMTNTATLESNLRAGNVNMLSSVGLTLDQALAFEKKIKSENLPYEMVLTPAFVFFHLDFNLDNPILKDLKVRQALAYAINREELTKAFLEGRQKPAHHFAAETDSWYTSDKKDFRYYEFSRTKAGKLLDESGWKMGADGVRAKNGKKLSLRISGAAENRFIETQQVYIQDALKQVGIELLVKNYPTRVLFPEILRKRNFDLGMYAWVPDPDETGRAIFHSSMIPSEANGWAGFNRPGWKNKQVDQWLDEVGHEFNPKKRIEIMRHILRAYTEELPSLPLYFRLNNSVIPKGLQNFHLSGHVHSEFLEVENWE